MKQKLMAALLLIASSGGLFAGDKPAAEAIKINQMPILDGKLDEPFWREIKAPLATLHVFKEAGKTTDDTRVKIAYDDKYLYFGLECKNNEPGYDRNTEKVRDGAVSADESVEILISSAPDRSNYYHFMLNCANVKAESNGPARSRDRNWNTTWLSAVAKNDQGWTAEIAIPLYILVENGRVGPLSFNVFRVKIIPEFDAQGVRLGAKKQWSSLCAVANSCHEPEAFAELKGLEALKIPGPSQLNWQTEACRLRLDDGAVGEYNIKDGKTFYDVFVKASYGGSNYNWSFITVADKTEQGKLVEVTEKVCVGAGRQANVKLAMPVENIENRTVTVILKDYITHGVVDQLTLTNLEKLTPLDAYFSRNYYTLEKYAELACAVSLPSESLKGARIILKDSQSQELFQTEKIGADNLFQVNLGRVALGANSVDLELMNKDGKPLFRKSLTLIKRNPKPGHEWKIDQLNGVLLNNGKPFFPFGTTLNGYTENMLNDLTNMGCNLFVKWDAKFPEDIFAKASAKGLYIWDSLESYSTRRKIPNLANYLSGDELKQADGLYSANGLQSTLNCGSPAFKKLTRLQRNEIFKSLFDVELPEIMAGLQETTKHASLMGYASFDEPGFAGFDMFVQGRELYKRTNEADGYHPTWVLYSSHIPPGAEATDWCDILCTDPYWVPDGTIAGRSSINWVSKIVCMTKQRADAARKMTWIVPMGSYWCASHRRVISPAEQICQSYLAVIHGAKGLTYFVLPPYKPLRDALKTFGEQLAVFAPALLAPAVKQAIAYRPVEFKPENNSYPDVQTALFKYPEGEMVLLAANSTARQVKTSFTLSCLPDSGEIKRLFAPDNYKIINKTFEDSLEPYGVRAYRIVPKDELPAPVKIIVKSEPDGRFPAPAARSATVDYSGRKGKKNVLPNPSFEEATLPGWPDYTRLFYKTIVGDHLKLVETQPYDGKVCVELTNRPDDPSGRLTERVGFHTYCAPQNPKSENYTLSVYMKGSKDGQEVYFGSYDWKTWDGNKWIETWKPVKISREWKRYAITGPVPANADNYLWVGVQIYEYGTVWLDAMQVEKGVKPTEFEQ